MYHRGSLSHKENMSSVVRFLCEPPEEAADKYASRWKKATVCFQTRSSLLFSVAHKLWAPAVSTILFSAAQMLPPLPPKFWPGWEWAYSKQQCGVSSTDGGLASLLWVNGVLLKIVHICWLWRLLVPIRQALHPAWQPCVWLSRCRKGILVNQSGERPEKGAPTTSKKSQHIRGWIIWEKATSCCCFFNNASAWWPFPLHHGAPFPNCAARLFDIYREIGKHG